jgi:hypothetical protein
MRVARITVKIVLLAGVMLSCRRAITPPVAEAQAKPARDLSLVLIDMDSKQPVTAARIALAPKTKDKDRDECTIDNSLTGLSNERGEVHLENVEAGEYIIIQVLSDKIEPKLQGKVVSWGRSPTDVQFTLSLGPALVTHGTMAIVDGALVITNAYMEASGLAMRTDAGGRLLTVRVPGSGRVPIRMEIPGPKKSAPAK